MAAKAPLILQSIIVKRTHPLVRTAADAYRVARHYGATVGSKAETTSTSFRFRQAPPKHFKSFRTKVLSPHVSLVFGILARPNPKRSCAPCGVIRVQQQGANRKPSNWTSVLRRVES